MAVSFSLTASPTFPAGTTVGAYPAALWAGLRPPQPEQTPAGPAVASAPVDGHGFATFSGLAAESTYFAGAEVGGVWKWVSFRTAAEAAGQIAVAARAADAPIRLACAMNYQGVVQGKHGPLYVPLFQRYYDRLVFENETKIEKVFNGGTRVKPAAPDVHLMAEMLAQIGPTTPFHYHTLIWHINNPEWLTNPLVAWTEETLRAAAKLYIQGSLTEAMSKGTMVSIDVLNEVLTSATAELRQTFWTDHFGASLAIVKTNPVIRFYAECFKWAWEVAPGLPLFYNEASLELDSQYEAGVSGHEKGLTALGFVGVLKEALTELGVPLSVLGVGFECHRETGTAGVNYPSTAELTRHIREFQALGCQTRISELDMKVKSGDTLMMQAEAVAAIVAAGELTGSEVGTWGVTNASTFQGGSSFLNAAVTLPAATIELESTEGFASSGEAVVNPFSPAPQTVKYTAVSGKKLTGCTLGTGTIPIGTAVVAKGAAGPQPLFWSPALVPAPFPSWAPLAAARSGGGPAQALGLLTRLTNVTPPEKLLTHAYTPSEEEAGQTGRDCQVSLEITMKAEATEFTVLLGDETELEKLKAGTGRRRYHYKGTPGSGDIVTAVFDVPASTAWEVIGVTGVFVSIRANYAFRSR